MKMQSAVDLRADIFTKVFNFTPLAGAAASADSEAVFVDPELLGSDKPRAVRKKRRDKEDIALGMSVADEEDNVKLAILVQNRYDLKDKMVRDIVQMASEEVEVIYIGRQKPLWTKSRNQPLRLGCSASPAGVNYSGTLGCFCKDNATGKEGMLSNNHVYGNVNKTVPGTAIIQQSAGDGGTAPADNVGKFERYVPIQFGGLPNMVDAAFALLDPHGRQEDKSTIFGNNNPPNPIANLKPNNPVTAYPGLNVMKTGRTTGHTKGRVLAINVNNYLVNMGAAGVARFDNQITFEMANSPPSAFGKPGDSGSIIVDDDGNPVALLFAGSASGGAGNLGIIAGNPISTVESQLNIKLI